MLTLNIQNGDLLNLYEVPHLELDAPWWTEAGIEELTFNGRCYQVGGDIAVSLLEGINCMFYNKQLAEDFSVPICMSWCVPANGRTTKCSKSVATYIWM